MSECGEIHAVAWILSQPLDQTFAGCLSVNGHDLWLRGRLRGGGRRRRGRCGRASRSLWRRRGRRGGRGGDRGVADHLHSALQVERDTCFEILRREHFFPLECTFLITLWLFSPTHPLGVVSLYHTEAHTRITIALTLKRPSSLYPPVSLGGAVLCSWWTQSIVLPRFSFSLSVSSVSHLPSGFR